jgi:signal recognition particle receptor subunit beta
MFPHIMELANIPGNEATFVVDATHMDSAAAFSPEAMDVLSTELLAFVVSRIMREWKSDDDAPHHLQVDIRVLVS